MPRLLVLCLLLCAAIAARAAEPGVLSMADSQVAVRIADPFRQMTAFAPVTRLVDGLLASQATGSAAKPFSVQAFLDEGLGQLKQAPGVSPRGDLWILVPKRVRADDPKAGPLKAFDMTAFVLIPLLDGPTFSRAMAVARAGGIAVPPMKVIGNVAVLGMGDAKVDDILTIQRDLTLTCKREVVISARTDVLMPDAPAAGPMAALLGPVFAQQAAMRTAIARVELGLSMVGADLSAEVFVHPTPDSPLAKSLAAAEPDTLGWEYAAYMPQTAAACTGSAAALPGMPRADGMVLPLAGMLFGMMAAPEQTKPVLTSMERLAALCAQGGAVAITTPTAGGRPVIVAAYQVGDAALAHEAVTGLADAMRKMRAAMGEPAGRYFTCDFTPGAEKAGDISVDLLKVVLRQDAPKPAPDAANPPDPNAPQPLKDLFSLEFRFAYLEEKLLVTMGQAGAPEMVALVERVTQRTPSFADTARFQALKGAAPGAARSFGMVTGLDLATALVAMLPQDKSGQDLRSLVGLFPPQVTAITTTQDVRNGLLHMEAKVPYEQLGFLYTVGKAVQMFQADEAAKKKAAADAKPA